MYNHNKNIFNVIETEEEAYWLGFILADGHNHRGKYLRVDIKDKGHLEKLSKLIYIDGDKPIKERDLGYGKVYYLHCGITSIISNLDKHGIVPNKSKVSKLPLIPTDMYRHFIRGVYDGDGSMSYSMDGNYRRYIFSIVGNIDLMEGIRDVVFDQTTILLGLGRMKMIHRVYKKGNQQIMSLLNWLYKDSSVYLDRKYKNYMDMLDYYKTKNT